jgi:hypothetical protein
MPYKMREMVSFAALAPRSLACIRPTRLPVLRAANTMSKMLKFYCKLQVSSGMNHRVRIFLEMKQG